MQPKIHYSCVFCPAGTPHRYVELYNAAWEECTESHIMDRPSFVKRGRESVEAVARYELTAYTGRGVVGAMVVVNEDDDPHVGHCLSVAYHYVLPQWRGNHVGRVFLKAATQLARDMNYNTLAYTHRVGAGKYLTTYRKIHGKENQEPCK